MESKIKEEGVMNAKLMNRKLNEESLDKVAGGMGDQGTDDYAARRVKKYCPHCNANHPEDTSWFEEFSGGRLVCCTLGCNYTYLPGQDNIVASALGTVGNSFRGGK